MMKATESKTSSTSHCPTKNTEANLFKSNTSKLNYREFLSMSHDPVEKVVQPGSINLVPDFVPNIPSSCRDDTIKSRSSVCLDIVDSIDITSSQILGSNLCRENLSQLDIEIDRQENMCSSHNEVFSPEREQFSESSIFGTSKSSPHNLINNQLTKLVVDNKSNDASFVNQLLDDLMSQSSHVSRINHKLTNHTLSSDNVTNSNNATEISIAQSIEIIDETDSSVGSNYIAQRSAGTSPKRRFSLLSDRLKKTLHKNAKTDTPAARRSVSTSSREEVKQINNITDDSLDNIDHRNASLIFQGAAGDIPSVCVNKFSLKTSLGDGSDIGPFFGLPSKVEQLLQTHRSITGLYGVILFIVKIYV